MNSKKIILASLISFYGISQAQQSKYFNDKEAYRYNLAENLYQSKIYGASQYEYARQYFYNQTLSESKKEAALFFNQVISMILQQNHSEEGFEAFMKEYPNSSFFAQANGP